ncbi:hypothetical protein Tco_0736643 [Tanacetum coccineum]
MQSVQGRQAQGYVGSGAKGIANGTWANRNIGNSTANQTKLAKGYEVKKRSYEDEKRGKVKIAHWDEHSAARQKGLLPGRELDCIDAWCKTFPPDRTTLSDTFFDHWTLGIEIVPSCLECDLVTP